MGKITFSKKYYPYGVTTSSRYDILINGAKRGEMELSITGKYNRYTRRTETTRKIYAFIDDNYEAAKKVDTEYECLRLLNWGASSVENYGGVIGAKKMIILKLEKLIESLNCRN